MATTEVFGGQSPTRRCREISCISPPQEVECNSEALISGRRRNYV
ncbi:hypothetical protein OROHE_009933 [Orobanche hederae]